MGLQRDPGGYEGFQGVTRVRRGDMSLQGVTSGYRGLQGVTLGYKGLQGSTWGSKGFLWVRRVN